MPPEKTDLLQGTLDLLILKALALGAMHGFGIAQRLEQMSGQVLQVGQGSLYPALRRLEQRGWIHAAWAPSENNRRARYYRLTRSGERQLRAEVSQWERLSAAVSGIVARESL
jgi:transcriptional regulator